MVANCACRVTTWLLVSAAPCLITSHPGDDHLARRDSGPGAGIVRAADYNSALELVNSHASLATAAPFTSNGHTAREFVHHVQAGWPGVNVPVPVPMAFHSFGGWKRSVGVERSRPDGVRFYTRMKTATVRWPAGQQTVSEPACRR
ncbi:aldehyde dehydrogenase family protein [Klebsiella pneumoniae]|nr:aldehyde dehydrogenase family protein [Klebsiella pneumoniae]